LKAINLTTDDAGQDRRWPDAMPQCIKSARTFCLPRLPKYPARQADGVVIT
jgi:hypothetical protein